MSNNPSSFRQYSTQISSALPKPALEWRARAFETSVTQENHDRLLSESKVFDAVRIIEKKDQKALTKKNIRIASWNLERCKKIKPSAELIKKNKVDICLLTEMDLGMARSQNLDTTSVMSDLLNMSQAYAVEFIELGLGDKKEQQEFNGISNSWGLHGNGILSSFPIVQSAVLPLDPGGLWFNQETAIDQRRIGGRMAVAVCLLVSKPVWFVAVHYESLLGPKERELETQNLLQQIHSLCGDSPVMIGGDFNCRGLLEKGLKGIEILNRPQDAEPMFQSFLEHGFEWKDSNLSEPTTRNHPWINEPLIKIDWFFTKGLKCSNPIVIPAVDETNENLSDHEMILVDVSFD